MPWEHFIHQADMGIRGRGASKEEAFEQAAVALTAVITYDVVTRKKVVSREMPLQSIELDLEDVKNPRINVTIQFDNKVIKHILFLPSQLVLKSSDDDREQSLQVETVNTETTVRFRAPVPISPA